MAQSIQKLVMNNLINAGVREAVNGVKATIKNYAVASIHFTSDEPMYQAIFTWLIDQRFDSSKNLKTSKGGSTFNFWHKSIPIWVKFGKEPNGPDHIGPPIETMSLSTLAPKLGSLKSLVTEIYNNWNNDLKGHYRIFDYCDGKWFASKKEKIKKQPPILAKGVLENLNSDLDLWTSREDFYKETDVPYRRAYCFTGPPGTGKSSLAKYIASKQGMDVYFFSSSALDKNKVTHAFKSVPSNSMIVIEDIDSLYKGRVKQDDKLIDFSKLINSLDGLIAKEKLLIVITTNNKSLIDPALIRRGRIDIVIDLLLATRYQAEGMLKKFFPSEEIKLSDEFLEGKLSTAEIQDKCLGANSAEIASKLITSASKLAKGD